MKFYEKLWGEEGFSEGESVVKGGNIVDAVEVCAVLSREKAHDHGGERGCFGQIGVCKYFSHESFSGESHEDGAVCHAQ